jgi:hypothetical protein
MFGLQSWPNVLSVCSFDPLMRGKLKRAPYFNQ